MKRIIKITMMMLLIVTVSSCTEQERKCWYLKEGIAISMQGDTLHFNGGVITMSSFTGKSRSINGILLKEDFIEIKEE